MDSDEDESWDLDETESSLGKFDDVLREPPPISLYNPAKVSMKALQRYGPALASGLWGMSNTVQERLARIEVKRDHLAEWVEFRAKQMVADEKLSRRPRAWEAAKNRAEQLRAAAREQQQQHDSSATVAASASVSSSGGTADDGNNTTTGDDGNKRPHVFTDEQKEALVDQLIGGNYETTGIGGGNDITSVKNGFIEQALRRHAARNGTYFPENREAFVRKAMMVLRPPRAQAR